MRFPVCFSVRKQYSYIHSDSEIVRSPETPEEIIKNPGNGFVREFILKQLEIKKNNIYSLFTVPKNIPGVAAGKVQEILTGREELVQVS